MLQNNRDKEKDFRNLSEAHFLFLGRCSEKVWLESASSMSGEIVLASEDGAAGLVSPDSSSSSIWGWFFNAWLWEWICSYVFIAWVTKDAGLALLPGRSIVFVWI